MLIFSLVFTAIMPLTMIGFGLIFMKRPPKEINGLYGYRTSMSSKNKDTWNFAHRYAGKVWLWSGIVTVIISVVLIFSLQKLSFYNYVMTALIYIQLVILLLVIPITERALKKTFDKNGNRR